MAKQTQVLQPQHNHVSHSLHIFLQFDLCASMLSVFVLSGERGREGPKGEPGYPGNTGVNGLKGGPGDLGQEGPAGTGLGIVNPAVHSVTVQQPHLVVSLALVGLSQLRLKQEG